MHEFQIYRHPIDRLEAAKEGWSWPGFFLACFWALYKKLWLFGGVALGVSLLLSALMPFSRVPLIFDLACCVAFGYFGNAFRVSNLLDRGFELVNEVSAKTPDGTIAEHLRNMKTEGPDVGSAQRVEPSF